MFEIRASESQDWSESDADGWEISSSRDEGSTQSFDDDEVAQQPTKVKESAPPNSLRIFMVIILVVVTFFGVIGIYSFGRAIERDEFNAGMDSIAHRIETGCNADAQRKMETLQDVSELLATYVLDHDDERMKWPFVSLPRPTRDLEIHRKAAGFDAIFFMPIVSQVDRVSWERYSYQYSGWLDGDHFARKDDSSISLFIKNKEGQDASAGPYAPQWQYSPLIQNRDALNFNWRALDGFAEEFQSLQEGSSSLSHVWTFNPAVNSPSMAASIPFQFFSDLLESRAGYSIGEPVSFLSTPIFEDPSSENSRVVGIVTAAVRWRSLFENLFQEATRGVVCVVRNSFGQVFTLELNGEHVLFIGFGDHHDSKYDDMVETRSVYFNGANATAGAESGPEVYRVDIYPSAMLEPLYLTAKPAIYGSILFTVFAFTSVVFLAYDCFVESRQQVVASSADQARALVNSLFPEVVGNRLIEEQRLKFGSSQGSPLSLFGGVHTGSIDPNTSSVPIAEFFVDTTIMFADIKGFTAWSSSREPAKVFVLLESIFGAFDKLAKKRRVFKIETVGDCYVAVCGLPEPRKDHALAMARFANDCLKTMRSLVVELEQDLGPGTSDLEIRVGLHSGSVTAGVLRGEKTRFQLFGDTVNTAARMESTGVAGKIQLSETTAQLILDAGKVAWIKARQETVHAKGKGEMNTFWLDLSHRSGPEVSISTGSGTDSVGATEAYPMPTNIDLPDATLRLVGWNVEVLKQFLKKIVARRATVGSTRAPVPRYVELEFTDEKPEAFHKATEVLEFAPFEPKGILSAEQVSETSLGDDVENELYEFVVAIAQRYRDNHFHSFAHCCHVMLSVDKLLTRIVKPKNDVADDQELHDSSYGYASDPLAQWSLCLAALVHDVDHQGISNDQLMKERPMLAKEYNYSSVAEKVSFDLAWSLLMEERFTKLRQAIYCNESEYRRFKQLMVNAVLATDVIDPKLKQLRDIRWENAFSHDMDETDNTASLNSKATVVLQHLMEASDVAHCMQHWHVYRKWNMQLFREISKAYRDGRCGKDPATFWYAGELAFFDKWVIPLAKKLQQCKAFGVSSDEYLDYALQNRVEWERRGKEEVQRMVDLFQCDVGP